MENKFFSKVEKDVTYIWHKDYVTTHMGNGHFKYISKYEKVFINSLSPLPKGNPASDEQKKFLISLVEKEYNQTYNEEAGNWEYLNEFNIGRWVRIIGEHTICCIDKHPYINKEGERVVKLCAHGKDTGYFECLVSKIELLDLSNRKVSGVKEGDYVRILSWDNSDVVWYVDGVTPPNIYFDCDMLSLINTNDTCGRGMARVPMCDIEICEPTKEQESNISNHLDSLKKYD